MGRVPHPLCGGCRPAPQARAVHQGLRLQSVESGGRPRVHGPSTDPPGVGRVRGGAHQDPSLLQPRRFSTTSTCSTAPSRSSARGRRARPWPCATRKCRLAVAMAVAGPAAAPSSDPLALCPARLPALGAFLSGRLSPRCPGPAEDGKQSSARLWSHGSCEGTGRREPGRSQEAMFPGTGPSPPDTLAGFLGQQSPAQLQVLPCSSSLSPKPRLSLRTPAWPGGGGRLAGCLRGAGPPPWWPPAGLLPAAQLRRSARVLREQPSPRSPGPLTAPQWLPSAAWVGRCVAQACHRPA